MNILLAKAPNQIQKDAILERLPGTSARVGGDPVACILNGDVCAGGSETCAGSADIWRSLQ
jgi:hypothetical protein